MKFAIAAALCAVQAFSSVPASAAGPLGIGSAGAPQMSTFAGARLRLPLGRERAVPVAALTVTSTLRHASGELRFAPGAEIGFHGKQVRVDFAGKPVSRLVQGRNAPDGQRSNVSTVGWIAIGVGAAALTVVGLYVLCGTGQICSTDDE